jgi:hypothetical protein
LTPFGDEEVHEQSLGDKTRTEIQESQVRPRSPDIWAFPGDDDMRDSWKIFFATLIFQYLLILGMITFRIGDDLLYWMYIVPLIIVSPVNSGFSLKIDSLFATAALFLMPGAIYSLIISLAFVGLRKLMGRRIHTR